MGASFPISTKNVLKLLANRRIDCQTSKRAEPLGNPWRRLRINVGQSLMKSSQASELIGRQALGIDRIAPSSRRKAGVASGGVGSPIAARTRNPGKSRAGSSRCLLEELVDRERRLHHLNGRRRSGGNRTHSFTTRPWTSSSHRRRVWRSGARRTRSRMAGCGVVGAALCG